MGSKYGTFTLKWSIPKWIAEFIKSHQKASDSARVVHGTSVQTLSLIDIANVKFHESGAIIIVNQIITTSAPNRPNPKLVLPYFAEKQCICPVKTLSSYITRMAEFRSLTNTNMLILTSKKPHHNASAQSISRWVKATLAWSGVDVSVFSAHSTRHAATSAARRAGSPSRWSSAPRTGPEGPCALLNSITYRYLILQKTEPLRR